ncbi:MFS transporter [Novosphingobium flavum]|uniref:MFS transporter n=1 Tax=Novosphingobium flavum TaxID=1778672 RepID=A0A7X1FTK2_9SPHN|nr:MFS transporter [Novosphingobium flavum]MBC2666708.1 MFS transporter [Novosphingobium flavum]
MTVALATDSHAVPKTGRLVYSRLQGMMFLQYVAAGVWLVPLGSYMSKTLRFDGIIGAAYGMVGLAAIASSLIVGTIADRYFPAQKVLAALSFMSSITLFWLSTIDHAQGLFLIAMLTHCLFYICSIPIGVTIAMNALHEPSREYPGVRVLGSTGWVVAGLMIGLWPGAGQTRIPMLVGSVTYMILAVYALSLPPRPPRPSAERLTVTAILGLDVLKRNRDMVFWVFMSLILVMVIPKKFYDSYLNNFLVEKGMNVTLLGLRFEPTAMQALGQAVEIVTILAIPYLIARIGIKWVMVLGMVGWVTRFLFFAYGFEGHEAIKPLILTGILLHGVSYDFLFTSGQIWLDKRCDPSIRARAQSFYWFILSGMGVVIGANVAGFVYGLNTYSPVHHDWTAVWLVPAAITLGAMALFIWLFDDRIKLSASSAQSDQPASQA